MTKGIALFCLLGLWTVGPFAAPAKAAGGLDEVALWDRLLTAHGRDGGLDYAALAQNENELDRYLATVAVADPDLMDGNRRLAFWINAYNAVVAKLVLDRYPGLESVRDVDGFFDELTYRVAGEDRTLDAIETAARDLGDPRVHFAVVCASTSCPDLRAEAFVADRLDTQLEEQTVAFLADAQKGLRLDERQGDLYLSSIFKWYAGDFTGGSTVVAFFSRGKVVEWLLPHLPAGLAARVEAADPSVRYLDYDWSLNDR